MKIKILLITTLLFIISGCGNKIISNIEFDNIVFNFESQKNYIKEISSNEESIVIYKEDTKENEEKLDFIRSIIFTKKKGININIKIFTNQNINETKERNENFELLSTKTESFNCNGNKITGLIKNFLIIKESKDIYFSQYFFIKENDGFIISFASIDKKDIDEFSSSIKKTSCKK